MMRAEKPRGRCVIIGKTKLRHEICKGDQRGEQISKFREKLFKYKYLIEFYGGDEGIRTLETLPGLLP